MSHIPIAKSSGPKHSLNQIATATGAEVDRLAGRSLQRECSSSSIPTPNPDIFKVGDRVWVGGTKQGTVRYIGTTNFAPGDWAGVELDESQGKNDGSVGGERYFTCQENHGVFSRCNRLSRKQSVTAQETQASTLRKLSTKTSSPMGAPGPPDFRGISTSPTLSPAESTTSLSGGSPTVGDRVIVASSMAGTKTGTLRYLGPTEFAKGEWAGIELDGPLGKNDGTVEGKRYFDCPPNHGLFAPIHKVTKSPKMRMMKPSALTPGKLRRESSNLSEMSTASSIAVARSLTTPVKQLHTQGLVTPATVKTTTSALKDSLREKDQYIEELIKERGLERAEVAKAASQTDEVETKLNIVQQELSTVKMEISQHLTEKDKLKNQLEEEKKRVEDLQFRLEEEQILRGEPGESEDTQLESFSRVKISELETSTDLLRREKAELQNKLDKAEEDRGKAEEERGKAELVERMSKEREETDKIKEEAVALKELRDKMAILSRELSAEQKRSEHLETEANKVFESEEQLMVLNEELSLLRRRLEQAEASLDTEKKRSADVVENARTGEFQSAETIIQLETDLKTKENQVLDLNHQIGTLTSKSTEAEALWRTASQESTASRKEVQELRLSLEKTREEVAERTERMCQLEARLRDAAQEQAELSTQAEEAKEQLRKTELALGNKEKEVESLRSNMDSSGSDFQGQVQEKIQEISALSAKLLESESCVSSLNKDVSKKNTEIAELKSGLESQQVNLTNLSEQKQGTEKEILALKESIKTSNEEVDRLSKAIAKRDSDLETVAQTIESLQADNQELSGQCDKLRSGFDSQIEEQLSSFEAEKDSILKGLKVLEEEITKLNKSLDTEAAKHREAIKTVEHEKDSECRKLEKKMTAKEKKMAELEAEIAEIRKHEDSRTSNKEAELTSLRSEAGRLEHTLAELRTEISSLQLEVKERDSSVLDKEADLTTLKKENLELTTEVESLRSLELEVINLRETLAGLKDEKGSLEQRLASLAVQSSDTSSQVEALSSTNTELSNQVSELKQTVSQWKENCARIESEKDQHEKDSKKDLEKLRSELDKENQRLLKQIDQLKENIEANEQTSKSSIDILSAKHAALLKDKEALLKDSEDKLEKLRSEQTVLKAKLDGQADELAEKIDRLESLEWTKADLEAHLHRLQANHDLEMGEMVDVVNDLKLKEDELATVHKDLSAASKKLDELCKQLLHQEQTHKEALKRKDAELEKKLDAAEQRMTEARNQAQFLKEQMASNKVENDLQVEKLRLEQEGRLKLLSSELEQKMVLINRLKDDLGAREEELEFTREELQAKKDEIEELSTDLDIKEASFNNDNKEIEEKHKEEIEVLISKNEVLNQKMGELKEKIAVQTSEFDSKLDEVIKQKKTEVNDLKDLLSEKESSILDLQMQTKNLESSLASLESTMKGETSLATTKLEKLSGENETLRRSKYELETSLKNLNSERDHIVHLNEDLSIRIVEFEVQVKEMNSQFQSLQVQYQQQLVELTEKQELMSQGASSLTDLEHMLSEERTRVDSLQVGLNDLEAERDQLRDGLNHLHTENTRLSGASTENTELRAEVTSLNRKNEFLFEELAKERLRLESKITTLAESLAEQKQEKQEVLQELQHLKAENSQLSSYKRQVLMLEQEKKDLETQLVSLTVETRLQKTKSPSPFLEGDDNLRGQVDFLNSVIVDMQRKSDELKSRLELLENAGVLDESVEFYYNGVSSRQPAPRLFCDICDQFDLHDTEDCPKQSSMVVEESGNTKNRGKRDQAPRPYCASCEMFGHETVDCNENETF